MRRYTINISICTQDLVRQLRENNISIGKVYNIIGSFFGSMSNVPFSKRALRARCGKISQDQADNDVRKTMEVFIVVNWIKQDAIPLLRRNKSMTCPRRGDEKERTEMLNLRSRKALIGRTPATNPKVVLHVAEKAAHERAVEM